MNKENIPENIARNITSLRRSAGMTQAALAEKIGYSDKSVSKWERGEGIPDVICLKTMADLFGVSVDYLLTADHDKEIETNVESYSTEAEELCDRHEYMINHRAIVYLTGAALWLITFAIALIIWFASGSFAAIIPIAAIPITGIVMTVFSSLWGNRTHLFISVMFIILGILLLVCWILRAHNVWLLMLLCIPAAAVVALACRVRVRKQ